MIRDPGWFNYRVISFTCSDTDEINQYLKDRGLDATDVIGIAQDINYNHLYEIFCRERVEH